MPLYEYICTKCEHEFEELTLSVSEAKQPPCPSCGNSGVTRKMSVFAAREGASKSPLPCAPSPEACGGCCGQNGLCPM